MNDSLQNTLSKLVQSGTKSNSALNVLISDYTKYHVVMLVVGGLFTLALLLLSVFFWRRFKRSPEVDNKWTFEKKTYLYFGLLSVTVGLLMALIVAANASNVVAPRQGFSGLISTITTPQTGTETYKLHEDVNAWLQSGVGSSPETLQNRIDDRLAWQRPKAIICTVLLAISTFVTARIWRTLIRKSRARETKMLLQDRLLYAAGILFVAICLLLMLMVIGNTQASFAPISLTLFYG